MNTTSHCDSRTSSLRFWGLAASTAIALALLNPPFSQANQRLIVEDSRTLRAAVSLRDLNVIEMPDDVTSVSSSKPDLEAKAQGRYVMVRVRSSPADLVVMAGRQAYVFQLVGGEGVAQRITVEDARAEGSAGEDDPIKMATDYVDGLLELIRRAALSDLPRHCHAAPIDPERHPKWMELGVVRGVESRCPRYRVTVYTLVNKTSGTQTLRESEFFTGKELAIALNRNVIEAGEEVTVLWIDPAPPPASK